MVPSPLNDDIKICGETFSGRSLQQRSCLGYIPDGAFELGHFIAKDNVCGLKHPPARRFSFFHGNPAPRISRDGIVTRRSISATNQVGNERKVSVERHMAIFSADRKVHCRFDRNRSRRIARGQKCIRLRFDCLDMPAGGTLIGD